MARYKIVGIQYGTENESELVQVNSNPEAILEALSAKKLLVHTGLSHRRVSVRKYQGLRIVDCEK